MSRDQFMFSLAVFFIIYGLAHINGVSAFVNHEARSNGRICIFLDTTFNHKKIYFRKEDLGRGAVGCPIYHIAD